MSGYNPASTTSNSLPQSTVTFYDKKFVDNLKVWTLFLRCAERRPLPMNSGNKLELFMYQPLAANITQVSIQLKAVYQDEFGNRHYRSVSEMIPGLAGQPTRSSGNPAIGI